MPQPPPRYPIGSLVRVILNDRNKTARHGRVRQVIWHFKDERYNYYIESDGKKVSKRYLADDLQPVNTADGA